MKTKKQDLINILTIVRPGLAKKGIVEESNNFIFSGKNILTYNDKICIAYPFETDFQCSVPANEFYRIVSGIDKEELELTLKNNKLSIKAQKTKAELSAGTGENILTMVDGLELDSVQKKMKPLPTDFIEGISLCALSSSKDQTNPVLTCLFINNNIIASTDDFRISEYLMKGKIETCMLIPAASILELTRFDVKKYAIDIHGAWAYFLSDDNLLFCCRLVAGEFPNYSTFFEGFDREEIQLPENIKQAISSSAVLTEGEMDVEKEISVEIKSGKIRCKGQNQIGWIEIENDIVFNTDRDINFSINPFFFEKILSHTNSMFIGENKALFKSGDFRHLIALKA